MASLILDHTAFDYYLTSSDILAVNDLVTAPDGDGSLLIYRDAGTTTEACNFAPTPDDDLQQGLSEAQLRVYMAVETMPSPSQGCGLLCMQSQRNLLSSGTAYGVLWQQQANTVRLIKIGNGLANGGSISTLATASTSGASRSFQLTWKLASNNAYIDLAVSTGTATGFTDLVPILSYRDHSPLTTHITEGGFYNDGGAGQDFAVRYDLLRLALPDESRVFPESIAYGAVGGPEYSTSVVSGDAGDEQRRSAWTYPRHRYQLSLAPRSAADTAELYAFFHAVAAGRHMGFRFPDFGAGESTGTLEPIGTGTGAVASYQLIKRYTSGSGTFDRIITKPVLGTVRLFVAGTETSAFAVDVATGLVTINATNGAAITASFRFHVPCRFASDRCAVRRVDGGYIWEGIEIVEIRDIDFGVSMYLGNWEYDPFADLVEYYTTTYGD